MMAFTNTRHPGTKQTWSFLMFRKKHNFGHYYIIILKYYYVSDIIIIIQYYNNYYNSILEYLLNYGSI